MLPYIFENLIVLKSYDIKKNIFKPPMTQAAVRSKAVVLSLLIHCLLLLPLSVGILCLTHLCQMYIPILIKFWLLGGIFVCIQILKETSVGKQWRT